MNKAIGRKIARKRIRYFCVSYIFNHETNGLSYNQLVYKKRYGIIPDFKYILNDLKDKLSTKSVKILNFQEVMGPF